MIVFQVVLFVLTSQSCAETGGAPLTFDTKKSEFYQRVLDLQKILICSVI